MGRPEFVHLHVHTDYSLLDGACETTELLDEASRQKMPAVAITDHGNLFAAANFFNEASKRDVKPIIGCEVYVAKGSRHDRGEKTPVNGSDRDDMEPGTRGSNHLVLLCENLEGYHNLIKLVSAGFLEGFYYKPRIDYDLLAKHSKGLIALSACLRGAVTEAVVDERYDQARENAYRLRDVFGTIEGDEIKLRSNTNERGDSVGFIFHGKLSGDMISGPIYGRDPDSDGAAPRELIRQACREPRRALHSGHERIPGSHCDSLVRHSRRGADRGARLESGEGPEGPLPGCRPAGLDAHG